jgi:hypothetical protein
VLVLALASGDAQAASLTENPFVQQAGPLASAELTTPSEDGVSVALSADGNTAIVGAPLDKAGEGAAFVLVRSGTTWTQQAKLEGKEASSLAHEGASVALSADGDTALVGAPEDTNKAEEYFGATFVFVREGSTWHEQQKLVAGTGATAKGAQGSAVSLAASGNVALVGAMDNEYKAGLAPGAAFVFARSGTTWTQQGGKLEGKHKGELVQQGTSVALSADGSTAVIGGPRQEGPGATPEEGGAWLFTSSGSSWTEAGELPAGTGAGTDSAAGQSVAVSGNGATVLVGGPGYKTTGTAWVYARSGASWSQQGQLLGEDASTEPQQGRGVALSENGGTALVGGYRDNTSVGAAWAFVRSGASWAEQQKIVGSGASGFEEQGAGVALSADGLTAIVGAPAVSAKGAAWIFTRAPEATGEPQPPPKHEPEPPPNNGGQQNGSGNTSTQVPSTAAGASGATAGIASTPAAVERLLLGCTSARLELYDAYIKGSRVALAGAAVRSDAGKRVKILFGTALKQVASATVAPDGEFSTTAPLPPAAIREALTTRYEAQIGNERSLHLKLTRRLLLEPPRASGTTVTLSGHVYPPLTQPIAPIVVEQQLECGHTTIVKRFTPPASGHYSVSVTVPAAARAGIFTLKSSVAANAHSTHHGFTTYSLPLPVVLG